MNVGIDTKLSDDTSSLANDTTNGTDIHLNSHMNTSTTINTVFMTAPQLPISSQLPSVLLVEDNEINLKVRKPLMSPMDEDTDFSTALGHVYA